MSIIDRHAYANALRYVDPAQKASLTLLVIALCLALNSPWVSLAAIGWMVALSVGVAALPAWVVFRFLAAEATFLLLTSVGILVSVTLIEPLGREWSLQLGAIWLSTSRESLAQAAVVLLRALGAAAAMNFLALTTPLTDLIALLRRLHMPLLLIDLMTLMYRFIFALLERAAGIYLAQDSRLGYSSPRRMMASAAQLGSMLFVDVYRRSERLQIALDSRGYQGDLRVLSTTYHPDGRWRWFPPAVAATLLLVYALTRFNVL